MSALPWTPATPEPPWTMDEYAEGNDGDPMFCVCDTAAGYTVADVYHQADAEKIARQAATRITIVAACRAAIETLNLHQHKSRPEIACEKRLCEALAVAEGGVR